MDREELLQAQEKETKRWTWGSESYIDCLIEDFFKGYGWLWYCFGLASALIIGGLIL